MKPPYFFENVYIAKDAAHEKTVDQILSGIRYETLHDVDGERHPGNGLLLAKNHGRFIKPCPGQKGGVCCGYWVVEWGMGCPFHCEYCIIQHYASSASRAGPAFNPADASAPGDLTLFVNWHDCRKELEEIGMNAREPIRLGTGQYGDPAAVESFFPLSVKIVEWAAKFDQITLEIKTKSSNITFLTGMQASPNVIAAFSLNPPSIADLLEHSADSFNSRVEAALKLHRAGYALALHFDPIVPLPNWENEYREVVEKLKANFANADIRWISLGTFRFPKGFREVVADKYPETVIFNEELYPSFDGKFRYFRPFRESIYSFMFELLSSAFPDVCIYMCMESRDMWERVLGIPMDSAGLKKMLDSRCLKCR